MLVIRPHNNGKGIKKENRNQLLKLRTIILCKNKCIPMVILTQWKTIKVLFQYDSGS